jgi:hypothetical protein
MLRLYRRSEQRLILGPGSGFALAQALDEANGGAGEIELGAELIFEEALEAEVQRRLLVGEQKKCGRRCLGLSDVVDTDWARLGRTAALQINIFL